MQFFNHSCRKKGNNYKGTLVVQSVRPVYGTQYETPILNVNDTNFSFEYLENQNMVFNERQFSGKNLIDVMSFMLPYFRLRCRYISNERRNSMV